MTIDDRPATKPAPADSEVALGMVFARRFRQARERSGLTQEQVAVAAGIDEMSASARISQYENGRHLPRYQIAVRLAHGLGVPVAYLYTPDDATAELLLLWCDVSPARRKQVLESLRALTKAGGLPQGASGETG